MISFFSFDISLWGPPVCVTDKLRIELYNKLNKLHFQSNQALLSPTKEKCAIYEPQKGPNARQSAKNPRESASGLRLRNPLLAIPPTSYKRLSGPSGPSVRAVSPRVYPKTRASDGVSLLGRSPGPEGPGTPRHIGSSQTQTSQNQTSVFGLFEVV